MKIIIICKWADGEVNGGFEENMTYEEAREEFGAENLLFYIPLEVCGKTYAEKKASVRNTAILYQYSHYEFINWSCYEWEEIRTFFEENGRRYGLIREFRENAII